MLHPNENEMVLTSDGREGCFSSCMAAPLQRHAFLTLILLKDLVVLASCYKSALGWQAP